MDDFLGSAKLSEKEKIILKSACEVFSEKGFSAGTDPIDSTQVYDILKQQVLS
jgi:hypothetical protein